MNGTLIKSIVKGSGGGASSVVTDGDNTGLVVKSGTIYDFGDTPIDTLVLTSVEKSYNESVIYFTTSGTITFTDNSGLKWGGGSAPSLEANTIYCIAINNGLAEIDSFGTTA